MNTVEFVVYYKREAGQSTTSRPFSNSKAANVFAYSIELDGGIAIVKPEIKGQVGSIQQPSKLEGTWE